MESYDLNLGEMFTVINSEAITTSIILEKCILINAGTYSIVGNIVSEYYYDIDLFGEKTIAARELIQPVTYDFTCEANKEIYIYLLPESQILSSNISVMRLA